MDVVYVALLAFVIQCTLQATTVFQAVKHHDRLFEVLKLVHLKKDANADAVRLCAITFVHSIRAFARAIHCIFILY